MEQLQHALIRCTIFGAMGILMMISEGWAKSAARSEHQVGVTSVGQEICVERLAKPAKQRSAFINKWV